MPFKSEAVRSLMNAVAKGKARRSDISQSVAKRLVADDPGGRLPEKVGKRLAAAVSQRKNNMDIG